jgi:hypothetical protein
MRPAILTQERIEARPGKPPRIPGDTVDEMMMVFLEHVDVGGHLLAALDDHPLRLPIVETALENVQALEILRTDIEIDDAVDPVGIVGAEDDRIHIASDLTAREPV